MTMQLLTLLALVLAIFIGFKRKVNTGLVSILFAFVLGIYILKMPARTVISGFPTSLAITLMGMTFLFAVAKVNGTLTVLAEKVSSMAKGNIKLLPIIFFIMSAAVAAVGPGPVVTTALMAPLALSIADKEDMPPVLMACAVISGSLAGGLSPLSPSGIIADTLAAKIGVTNYMPIFFCVMIASTLQGIAFYLFFGGLKLKNKSLNIADTASVSFDSAQKATLAVITLVVVGILFFKTDIGLAAFAGGTLLLLVYPKLQKEAVANISWDTILLIGGVAMLINVIEKAGGIKALIDFFSSIMTPALSTSVMAVIAGLMSTVSSASGVVMPTLIPTSAGIAQNMGSSVSAASIVAAIVVGAHAVTYSPFSTLGALSLAAAGEKADKGKLFLQLIMLEIANVAFAAILGVLGFYALAG